MAIAVYPCIICIGVTAAPWPIGRLPIVAPEYSLSFGTMPCSSFGNWTPVFVPKPNFSIHLLNFVAPIFWPIKSAPMFEERARIWPTVRFSVPCSSASLMIRSPISISGGTVNSVVGVTSPSSSAAETVNALKVEPGS